MPNTKPILVVIDPVHKEAHLLQEAAAHARGTGSELVVLAVMSTADYEARADAINELRDFDVHYTYDHAVESSRHVALRVTQEALKESTVEFTAMGYVGTVEDAVLAAAEVFGCESVIVGGHRRGLWDIIRRVRDLPASIERSFPGNVTVFYDHLLGEPSEADAMIDPATPIAVTR